MTPEYLRAAVQRSCHVRPMRRSSDAAAQSCSVLNSLYIREEVRAEPTALSAHARPIIPLPIDHVTPDRGGRFAERTCSIRRSRLDHGRPGCRSTMNSDTPTSNTSKPLTSTIERRSATRAARIPLFIRGNTPHGCHGLRGEGGFPSTRREVRSPRTRVCASILLETTRRRLRETDQRPIGGGNTEIRSA